MGLQENLRTSRLQLITPITGGVAEFTHLVNEMFAAGVDIIEVRGGVDGRPLTDADQQQVLEACRQVAFPQGKLLAIGRDVAAASSFGADLVHLGASDGLMEPARRQQHQYALMGRSVHRADALAAGAAEADYLMVGPVFGEDVPGLDLVRAAAREFPVADVASTPWFAVGGITVDNLHEVVDAGAVRVAVSAGILGASDPVKAAGDLAAALREVWNSRSDLQAYTMAALGGPVPSGIVLGAPGMNVAPPPEQGAAPEVPGGES